MKNRNYFCQNDELRTRNDYSVAYSRQNSEDFGVQTASNITINRTEEL